MKISYTTLLCFIFFLSVFAACDEYEEPAPLDIVDGVADLQQEYAKANLKNPVAINGYIKNKKTSAFVGKAKISARLENSSTVYNTFSREDGSYILYLEAKKTYIFYAEKEGFTKTYFSQESGYAIDTTFFIEYPTDVTIELKLDDKLPTFKVSYVADAGLYTSASDISFNGTNIVTIDDYYRYVTHYKTDGTYLNMTPFIFNQDFFVCLGTDAYLAGEDNYPGLTKIDQKTGLIISSFKYESTIGAKDVEVLNDNIFLLSSYTLYKTSLTGAALDNVELTTELDLQTVVGFVQKNNYLYVLGLSDELQYVLYKIDPATLSVIAKGFLPLDTKYKTFRGLTFDGTNFWTINPSIGLFYKFSVKE